MRLSRRPDTTTQGTTEATTDNPSTTITDDDLPIPEQLAEFWPEETQAERDAVKAWRGRHPDASEADVRKWAHGLRAKAAQRAKVKHVLNAPTAAPARARPSASPEITDLAIPPELVDFWPSQDMPEMEHMTSWRSRNANQDATPERIGQVLHQYRMGKAIAAKKRHTTSKENRQQTERVERARRTCQVCGLENLEVLAVDSPPIGQWVNLPGADPSGRDAFPRSDGGRRKMFGVTACAACCLVLADVARDHAAAEVLPDGRTRAEAAAAFLGYQH